jgi:hypothetical protein
MKTIIQIKKEIEEYTKGNTCGEFNIKIRELQALLDYSNEIIEEIVKLNISKYNWTVDEFTVELKSIIIGKEKNAKIE